ncbi:MAG: hypothetical protein V1746_01555 [bacterium]
MRIKVLALMLGLPLVWMSCSSTPPPYESNNTATAQMGNSAFRYGTIGGAGAAGYFLGNELGGPVGGGIGAAAGAGGMYAVHKVYDKKQMDAFNKGREAGIQEARGEIVNEMWQREAVYGLPPEDEGMSRMSSKRAPIVRNVHVPSRTVQGVKMQGGNQQVMLP